MNPKLFPNSSSNFPSYCDHSVIVNEIAPVEEYQTSHQTSVWREQDPLPKASDHPDKKPNILTIYTQNAHGLRANEEKLEYESRLMDAKSIDAYMLQEIHPKGDFIDYLPKG